ncbi:MAG: hypothetical protein U0840_03710 [Gemmataceae bacterium]
MERRGFLVGVGLLALAGCGRTKKTPDQMSPVEFNAWLEKQLGLNDLKLTEEEPGQFVGAGTKAGKKYDVTVTRSEKSIIWQARGESEILRGGVKR